MLTVNHHWNKDSYPQTAIDQIKLMGHVSEDVLYGLIDGHAAYETAYNETFNRILELFNSIQNPDDLSKEELQDELSRIRDELDDITDMDFEN